MMITREKDCWNNTYPIMVTGVLVLLSLLPGVVLAGLYTSPQGATYNVGRNPPS